MVTSGLINGYYVTQSEVLDLLDPTVSCDPWIDYPLGVFGAVGTLLQSEELLITCGGSSSYADAITNCYLLEPTKVTEIGGLHTGSFSSAAGLFSNSLFIAGGCMY